MLREIREPQLSLRAIVEALKPQESKMTEENKGNSPAYEVRAGAVKATVWANEAEKDGKKWTNYSVSIQRGYKDKKGEWQNTSSFNTSDVPKATSCMQRAYEWIISQKSKKEEE